jgi:O-acetyl-ADP-ribose deacetylase (regulator of RNase III)
MNVIKGDLIKLAKEGRFDVIVHGCNCMHCFGAGIAFQIRKHFPDAFIADCETVRGDIAKLGTISRAIIDIGKDYRLHVVNAYTQARPEHGRGRFVGEYGAIRSCFKEINKRYPRMHVGYPMIGAGLAGGDWDIISRIIDDEMDGNNHTLVEWNIE